MGKKRGRYQKRSPEQWRQLVEDQRSSGESVCGFAESRGISKSSLCRWGRLLGDAAPAEVSEAGAMPCVPESAGSELLELVVREQALALDARGGEPRNDEFRLLVGDGVCLALAQLPPPEYLALVARTYEAVRS